MKIKTYSDAEQFNLVMSVCGNGSLMVCDLRCHSAVFQQKIHTGAVNLLDIDKNNQVITASADQSAKILDPCRNWQEQAIMTSTSSILCGESFENILILGCADGNILVYNTLTQECLFGYGADNQGGVNCLTTALNHHKLITGGESGVPLLLSFD